MSSEHQLGGDVEESISKAVSAPSFVEHEKKIHTPEDLNNWIRSRAYYDVVAYINNTSVAIQGQKVRGKYPITEQMRKLCNIFNRLDHLVNENLPPGWQLKNLRTQMPPVQSTRQSCISSYRTWMRHMHHHVFFMLDKAINPKCQFLHELGYYFSQSFGSPTCLDFGPGNELMFIFFLCGLFKASVLIPEDTIAAALMLYDRYIHLVRRLINVYKLPTSAIRKQYNFVNYYALCYVWGAAQLAIDSPFDPLSCESTEIVKEFRDDYLIASGIDCVQKHRGRLCEYAYQLWCIFSSPNWIDVYDALSHGYIKGILGSFSIVTNCVFSDLMSFDFVPTGTKIVTATLGNRQRQQSNKFIQTSDDLDKTQLEEQEVYELKPPVERYMGPDKETTLLPFDNQTRESINYYNNMHPHPFCMPRNDLQMVIHSTVELPAHGTLENEVIDVGNIGGATFGMNKGVVSSGLQFGKRMTIGTQSTTDSATSSDNSK